MNGMMGGFMDMYRNSKDMWVDGKMGGWIFGE